MNYQELIATIQQYLRVGYKALPDYGPQFLRSTEEAINDRAVYPEQRAELIAIQAKLAAMIGARESMWLGSTCAPVSKTLVEGSRSGNPL